MSWKRLAGAVAIVATAVTFSAVLGQPESGQAADATPPQNNTVPVVSGTPQEGHTLATSNGSWSTSGNTYSYQWLRCDNYGNNCAPIAGATSNTYMLVAADVGQTIRSQVTAHNGGDSQSATSVPTALILPAAPSNTGLPTISGTALVGSTLTATNGTWSGTVSGYAYAWERCDANGNNCTTIAGATDHTYKLTVEDGAHTLRVIVTASNDGGSTPATSKQTAAVSGTSLPKNTALPVVSGSVQVGSTLTATKGTWSGTVTGYAYAWKRCGSKGQNCSPIAKATHSTYKLTRADAGTTLRVTVTASNGVGSTAASSAPTAVVPVPAVTGCPSGTGAIKIAQLKQPARLMVSKWSTTVSVVPRSASAIQLHIRVTACNGRPVQGATVFAVPIPYNQFKGRSGTTGSNGTVTLAERRLRGFPATHKQELLAVLVRASKPGTSVIGGISTRRVVSFKVSRH